MRSAVDGVCASSDTSAYTDFCGCVSDGSASVAYGHAADTDRHTSAPYSHAVADRHTAISYSHAVAHHSYARAADRHASAPHSHTAAHRD